MGERSMLHFAVITINPEQPIWWMAAGLIIITLLVLIMPFKVKWCEHNLEVFFLVMGLLAVTISWQWSGELVIEALKAPVMIRSLPIGIFQVVLVFGLLIYFFYGSFYRAVRAIVDKLSIRVFIFLLILVLGLISSLISVIVTSVILAEIVAALPLQRQDRIKLVVLACFSAGMGAVLTPLGEPMSAILVQRLAGEPYNAGFMWPIGHFWYFVVSGCLAMAISGAAWIGNKATVRGKNGMAVTAGDHPMDSVDVAGTPADQVVEYSETIRTVIFRAVKVFAFVAALTLLGTGLQPLIEWFLIKVPAMALYWINILSAVLDNATLTAIEVSVQMDIGKIIAVVMGLLIAGGMLIPGNIPNIVAAGRLKISMKEWAVLGVPIGLALMVTFFLALVFTGKI
jgi:predicted cation transporter